LPQSRAVVVVVADLTYRLIFESIAAARLANSLAGISLGQARVGKQPRDIQNREAFHDRAARNRVEALAVGGAGLAVAFGDVQGTDIAARRSWSASERYPRGSESEILNASSVSSIDTLYASSFSKFGIPSA